MGAPKYDTGSLSRPRAKRGEYKKLNKYDTSGRKGKEMRIMVSFWRTYTVKEVNSWTEEEFVQNLEAFFNKYEKQQIKNNKRWWYPEGIDLKRFG